MPPKRRTPPPQNEYTCDLCPRPTTYATSIDATRAFIKHYVDNHMEKPR